ncbi:hypothetical protein V8G54_022895 [Vigna mungo]|uniref:TIR domain-containing protein n=1 Tax=Vigna mungo TaxID=3915 RepID=A0AAQ3RRP0_VIGMU
MMGNDGAMCETKCRYDVVLSFRGEDTRHTFTCHLYHALCQKGIITFMDDGELKLGDQIGSTLLRAIEESSISIAVLSENYSDSSCFLFNVRENSNQIKGIEFLQQRLLSEILEDSKIQQASKAEGTNRIKHSLFSKNSHISR